MNKFEEFVEIAKPNIQKSQYSWAVFKEHESATQTHQAKLIQLENLGPLT